MYAPDIDEKTLSQLYDTTERTVKKIVSIIEKYDTECIASIVIRIRTICKEADTGNYKHLLLIGHIMGVLSTKIFEDQLIKNINDICLRQN